MVVVLVVVSWRGGGLLLDFWGKEGESLEDKHPLGKTKGEGAQGRPAGLLSAAASDGRSGSQW